MQALRSTLTPLVLAALSSVASAQEAAWRFDHSFDATRPAMRPSGIHPLADGGVIVVGLAYAGTGATGAEPSTLVVSEIGPNGDLRWTWDRAVAPAPPSAAIFSSYTADSLLGSGGVLYLLVDLGLYGEVTAIDPDGIELWTARVDSLATPVAPSFTHLVEGASGEIIVVACDYTALALVPDLHVTALGASGQLLWTAPQLTEFFFVPRGARTDVSGNIHVFGQSDFFPGYVHFAKWVELSPTGVRLSVSSVMSAGFGFAEARALELRSNGEPAVLVVEETGTEENVVLALETPGGGLPSVVRMSSERPGWRHKGNDLAVDAADRIYVAGAEDPSVSTTWTPALLRFDAAGAFLGSSVPSVVSMFDRGELLSVAMADNGDVLATGAVTGPSPAAVVARFRPDGSEVWSRRVTGQFPTFVAPFQYDPGGGVDVEIALDPRGNALVSGQLRSGAGATAMAVTKWLDGGPIGTAYCPPTSTNSTGAPGALVAAGSDRVVDDNVTLLLTDLPPGAFSLLLTSRAQGNVPNVGGGNGTLCLGGAIGRYVGPGQIRRARPDGTTSLQLDLDDVPQPTGLVAATAGETWNFQAWYRDANPTVTSDTTNGVALTLQ